MNSSVLPKLFLLGIIGLVILAKLAGPLSVAAQNAAMQQQAQQSNAWMQQQLEQQQQQMMLEMQQMNGLMQQGPGAYYPQQPGYPQPGYPGVPGQAGAYPQLAPGMDSAMYPQPGYTNPDADYYQDDY